VDASGVSSDLMAALPPRDDLCGGSTQGEIRLMGAAEFLHTAITLRPRLGCGLLSLPFRAAAPDGLFTSSRFAIPFLLRQANDGPYDDHTARQQHANPNRFAGRSTPDS